MSTNSFADEIRSRDESQLANLFALRPDLLAPLPPDLSALAVRANSTPSLMRAIENLNKYQYDILIAAATLTQPFKRSELIAVTDTAAGKILDFLVDGALIYSEGTQFRITNNLLNLLGDSPAGLGPITGIKVDEKTIKSVPKESLAVLEKLTWGPPRGSVSNIKNPGKAIGWLLENKVLTPIDSQTVALPREIGMYLRGKKVFESLQRQAPELTGTSRKQKDVDRAAIANISDFLRWCEELVHNWSDEPPIALKSGGLGIRDLKRTAEHIGIEESCAAFVAELLYLAGLIVIDTDDSILPTSLFDSWATRSHEERWHSLVTLWIETSRVAGLIGKSDQKNLAPLGPELDRAGISTLRKKVIGTLIENPEISPDSASIEATIKWLAPQRFNSDYLNWILREAEWLGITGQGAISSFGIALNSDSEDLGVESALPKPVDHILIQADNSAIAPGPLTIEIANELGTIADIESRGGATVYRFSEASIRRGLDHGKTGDHIKDFLKKTSKTPVPQPLEYLINDVAKRHGRLRIGAAATYLRCEDEGLITQIAHDKKIESLQLRKLAPQVLISEVPTGEVLISLREAGYLPAGENANGILISAPAVRRAKSRPRPPRALIEVGAPNPNAISAAVRAIKVGEKASSHKSQEIPRTTANETLEILNQYIEEQASLTIGYADTNGGVSNRLIDPISISLGTLNARDHASGQVVPFKISRITGVSLAK
jgi:hypothetical protein